MKFINIKSIFIELFILSIIIVPYISCAEMQIEIQEGEINTEISPNNPQPYQDVTINLSSYATDLNKAIITWKNESQTVLSGIGKTSYSFKTKGPNTSIIFNINITPVGEMNTITKTLIISPSEIEILWESVDGYTPPFYKGRSLPVSGGFIKAVAIPNTNTIKSGNGSVTYTWKNAGDTNLDASGYNKNSYIFKNDMFNNKNEITVVASSVTGNYKAENTIEIPIYDPKIIFYKKSPLEGILYNNAYNKEAIMTEEEITLVAEPYFMSLDKNDFSYLWKINNEIINTPSKKTELTIRPTSRGGYATISLVMENLNDLFQKASNTLKLKL